MSTQTRSCAKVRVATSDLAATVVRQVLNRHGIPLQARHPGRGNHRRRLRRRQRSAAAARVRGKGPVRPRRFSGPAGWRSARWRLPTRSRIATREFLVFNQELATLLKAGHAARAVARHPAAPRHEPGLQVGARRRATSGCARAARCRSRSRRTGRCFPASTRRRCWRARRAATSSRSSAATSPTSKWCRGVRRKTISALVYPAILLALSFIVVGDHRAAGRAGVRRRSTASSGRSCRCRRGSSSAISTFATAYFGC